MSGSARGLGPSLRLSTTKAVRDLTANRGRALLLFAANAIGLTAVVALVTGFSLLSREIERSFVGSQPASAILSLGPNTANRDAEGTDSRALLELAQAQSGVVAAELRRTEMATAQRPIQSSPAEASDSTEPIPLRLLVIDDFRQLQVSTFSLERGSFPGEMEIALEQSALGLLRSDVGHLLRVDLRDGPEQALTVSGVVHDPGQAPAWMEGMGYGYITQSTLARLLPEQRSAQFDELLLVTERGPNFTRDGIAGTVAALQTAWEPPSDSNGEAERTAASTRATISNVTIPPPGDHPHQGQMDALRLTLLVFALFALVLAGVLTLTTLQAFLHTQTPQIGTLKTLGASRKRITGIYALSLGLLGVGGAGLGVPLGLLLGREYARLAGGFLNLRMESLWLSPAVFFSLLAASLLLPVLVAAPALVRVSTRSVRECLASHSPASQGSTFVALPGLKTRPLVTYALRNALRQPRRMVLSLATLVVANALLLTAANVGRAWIELLNEADRVQTHEASLWLAPADEPGQDTHSLAAARNVLVPAGDPTTRSSPSGDKPPAEVWRSFQTRHASLEGTTFTVQEPPGATRMLDLTVISGRWLQEDDFAARDQTSPGSELASLVLDHAMAQKLGASVGDEIELSSTPWRATAGDVSMVASGPEEHEHRGTGAHQEQPSANSHAGVPGLGTPSTPRPTQTASPPAPTSTSAARFLVVGVVREVGSLGGGYVGQAPATWRPRSHRAFLTTPSGADVARRATSQDGGSRDPATRAAQRDLVKAATAELKEAGLEVVGSRTSATRNKGLFDHVVIFRTTLALMAGLLGLVGALGLLSAIGLNVLERTRELAVLRAVGARHSTLVRTLLLEGLALGLSAFAAAAALSIPLSWWAGARTGTTFVLVPLPLTLAPWAYAAALSGTLLLTTLASWIPARTVARQTVTRALSYV